MSGYANDVANRLWIRNGRNRKEVQANVLIQFRDCLDDFIDENMHEIKVRPVCVIFQNPRKPYKREFKRKGVTYIEKSLDSVVKKLPKLSEGEYYDFPSLEIILERNGTGFIYLRYA